MTTLTHSNTELLARTTIGNTEGAMEFEAVFIKQEERNSEDDNNEIKDNDLDLQEELSCNDSNIVQIQYETSEHKKLISKKSRSTCDVTVDVEQDPIANIGETEIAAEFKYFVARRVQTSATNQPKVSKTITPKVQLEMHKCMHCNKEFKEKYALVRHLLSHSGEKPHQCQHCEKKFNQAIHLKIHLLIHSGVKSHQCQQCKKEFSRGSHLKSHMLMHNGVRQHQCNQCEKSFIRVNNLKSHLLIHSGVKPYQCQHCKRGFSQSGSLKSHLLTHSIVKPYKCQHCEKGFNHASNFKSHLLKHSSVKQNQ